MIKQPTGEQLRKLRYRHGLTQAAAAKLIHSHLRTFQDWETKGVPMHLGLWELLNIKCKELEKC